jgi:hypothetical protein
MLLEGLSNLGAAGCFGWTKWESNSIRNGYKKCFAIEFFHCTIMSSLSSMFLGGQGGDLGAAAILDGQNVTEVQ